MPGSLLTTKLHIPQARTARVLRPRLVARMQQGLNMPLTLISAPAGFGKTTLLGEWLERCGCQAAWLSLDAADNDPSRFWAYFLAALQTICPSAGQAWPEALTHANLTHLEPLLIGLINELAEEARPLRLILDDYHLIESSAIHDGLYFLLEHAPAHFHLILSSRTDPPWPLGRLRARSHINEVRTGDLRFTIEESAVFLNDRMCLALADQDIATLEARTEGWIASLQLAALSMQGQADKHRFVEDLSGNHRFISDYLVEEALEKQSPAVQDFLLKTSLLSQMNASLCNALMEQDGSQAMLLYLEQANLFLQPLDNERCWYRYHHLFADLLRIRLQHSQPQLLPLLHQRASLWFEAHKMIDEAVSHAIAAGDFERVIRLVEGSAFSMLDTGELTTLIGWLDALPRDLVSAQPWLGVFYAWALAYTGQLNSAEIHLQQAEHTLKNSVESKETRLKREPILGHIAAVRTLITKNKGDMFQAVAYAEEALKYLPERDARTRCYVAQTQGNALLFLGHMSAASKAFHAAVAISLKANDTNRAVYALCDLAGLQWMMGQLHDSAASCRQALQMAEQNVKDGGRQSPGAGFAYARLARILLEWNDGEAALRSIEQGLALNQRRGQADVLFFCLVTLAEVQLSNKDFLGAQATYQQARPKTEHGASWHIELIDQFEAENLFAWGDLRSAEIWLNTLGWKVGDPIPEGQANAFEFVARILVAKGEFKAALEVLDWLLARERAKGVKAFILFMLITKALAFQGLRDREKALSTLDEALSQAEPEGYIRTFTDRGAPIRSLLQMAAERGLHPDYVRRLLDVLGPAPVIGAPPQKPVIPQLIVPLSERELDVLRLLNQDLSAPEIAEKLVITVNTTRSHIKSLYRKLDVHSRYEALVQARALNLL